MQSFPEGHRLQCKGNERSFQKETDRGERSALTGVPFLGTNDHPTKEEQQIVLQGKKDGPGGLKGRFEGKGIPSF